MLLRRDAEPETSLVCVRVNGGSVQPAADPPLWIRAGRHDSLVSTPQVYEFQGESWARRDSIQGPR